MSHVTPQGHSRADAYNSIAEAYAAENDQSLLNEYYNRPAIVHLLGNVRGRHVLDAGCGSGPLLENLLHSGASVVGIDGSPTLLDIARRRVGPDIDLRVADLAEPLPFPDNTYDDAVCSLTLHYLRDWSGPLSEFRRVLKPGGRLIISVEHPFAMWLTDRQNGKKTNYFATRPRTETDMAGKAVELTFWDRSLSSMMQDFLDAGFVITHIGEPAPSADAHEKFPEFFEGREDQRFLAFLFVVLEA